MNGTRFVWQIVKIVIGFVLGVVASGLFLSWGLFQPGAPDIDPAGFAAMVGTGLVTASVIGAAAFLPAGCAILISEFGRQSSVFFHVASGGVIAFLLWTMDSSPEAGLRPGSTIALAAGFISGMVYWGIAGRTAGNWRTRHKPQDTDTERGL